MKKIKYTLLLSALFILATTLVGCGLDTGTSDTKSDEGQPINTSDEKNEEEQMTQLEWPSSIPTEFPEYTDGDLVRVPENDRTYSPYLVWVENTSESAVEKYVEDLKSLGFTVLEEGHAYGDEDTAWMLGKGDSLGVLLALTYGEGDNDSSLVITFNN